MEVLTILTLVGVSLLWVGLNDPQGCLPTLVGLVWFVFSYWFSFGLVCVVVGVLFLFFCCCLVVLWVLFAVPSPPIIQFTSRITDMVTECLTHIVNQEETQNRIPEISCWQCVPLHWRVIDTVSHLGSEGDVGGGGWRAWNYDRDKKNPGRPPCACGLRSSEFPSLGDTTGKFIVISQSLCPALHMGLIRINPKPVCPFLCSQRRLDSCGEWLQTHCGIPDFHVS